MLLQDYIPKGSQLLVHLQLCSPSKINKLREDIEENNGMPGTRDQGRDIIPAFLCLFLNQRHTSCLLNLK